MNIRDRKPMAVNESVDKVTDIMISETVSVAIYNAVYETVPWRVFNAIYKAVSLFAHVATLRKRHEY